LILILHYTLQSHFLRWFCNFGYG